MPTHSISYEYLIKSRQLTWENAEFIDSCFGPIKLEERSVNENGMKVENRCQSPREITCQRNCNHKDLATTRSDRGTERTVKKKVCIRLDYNKVINVRVSLSAIDWDEYINKYNTSDDIASQVPVGPDSTSKGDPSVVASTRERLHGDHDNSCTICHKKLTRKSYLIRHLRTHTGEKPFSCPQCEKKFAQTSHLNKHLLIHSGTKQFSCDLCQKTFIQSSELKSHSLFHSGTKTFSCDICFKLFAHKSNLTRHRRTHTGDKPYKCTKCNAMFSQWGALKEHMRTHTGETLYQCAICEKKFTRLGGLKTHLLIHSEEKPFACTYPNCDKAFRRKETLQRHIRLHIENK